LYFTMSAFVKGYQMPAATGDLGPVLKVS